MRTSTKAEKKIKLAVAQAAEHIRNKFKEIHNDRKETYRLLEEQYKPITRKLRNLTDDRTSPPQAEPFVESNHVDTTAADADTIRRPQVLRFQGNRVERRNKLRGARHNAALAVSEIYNKYKNMDESGYRDEGFMALGEEAAAVAVANNSKRRLTHSDSEEEEEEALERRRSKATKVERRIITEKLNSVPPKALELQKLRGLKPQKPQKSQLKPKHRRSEAQRLASSFYNHTIPTVMESREYAMPAKRLTRLNSLKSPKASGNGMIDLTMKEFHNNDKACSNMFVYWNDVNELVSRLRLLVSSASAGHTGHNNEIISIMEELREADIIK